MPRAATAIAQSLPDMRFRSMNTALIYGCRMTTSVTQATRWRGIPEGSNGPRSAAVRASVGEPMRFHDLRHSHVAALIAQREHPKVIQIRLGHFSIKTTLDRYGHQRARKFLDGLARQPPFRAEQRGTRMIEPRPYHERNTWFGEHAPRHRLPALPSAPCALRQQLRALTYPHPRPSELGIRVQPWRRSPRTSPSLFAMPEMERPASVLRLCHVGEDGPSPSHAPNLTHTSMPIRIAPQVSRASRSCHAEASLVLR